MGACLLCLSALSTALTVLSGFLLSMAWIGVVVYTVLGKQAAALNDSTPEPATPLLVMSCVPANVWKACSCTSCI
jgi:hypothetical protein